MRRAVSLSGAAFALLCVVLILCALPAGAQDDGGIPPGTPVTPSDTHGGVDNPRVLTVESRGCKVPEQGATVTVQDQDGTRFKYRDGPEVSITEVGNGQVKLESRKNRGIMVPANAVSFTDRGFDPNPPITAVGSTGITGCRGGNGTSPSQDQYEQTAAEVDNPKGVVPETATNKKMPPTGGPPYLAVGALILLSVAVLVGGVILRP
jgi:hypothetical protein